MEVNRELLKHLCCPRCQGRLIQDGSVLTCDHCRIRYEIKDGIPILMIDE